MENDHEKVDRLIELHLNYFERVKVADNKLKRLKEVGVLTDSIA